MREASLAGAGLPIHMVEMAANTEIFVGSPYCL